MDQLQVNPKEQSHYAGAKFRYLKLPFKKTVILQVLNVRYFGIGFHYTFLVKNKFRRSIGKTNKSFRNKSPGEIVLVLTYIVIRISFKVWFSNRRARYRKNSQHNPITLGGLNNNPNLAASNGMIDIDRASNGLLSPFTPMQQYKEEQLKIFKYLQSLQVLFEMNKTRD